MTTGRRPLVIGVAELRRRNGVQRDVGIVAELSGLALSSARVPDDADIEVSLTLESLPEGITATGRVRAPWTGECRRCLGAVEGVLEASLREVFEPRPVEGETYELSGDHIDLEPMVRDAVLLALPLAPLCAEDCAGPAPEVFPTRPGDLPQAAVDDGEVERLADPRWAALDALRFDGEPDEG